MIADADANMGCHLLNHQRVVTCPRADRADYIRFVAAEAQRLWEIADVLNEFEFDDLALAVRLQASDYTDLAAQARNSLGADGLL